jgi:uncharacterized protein YdhG (YjbR/CyaY superfamily)
MAKSEKAPAEGVARSVEYLAGVPEPARGTLDALRAIIRAAAPEAEEVISYRVPTFKHHGSLVGFAAMPKHCSLFVMSVPLVEGMRERGELAGVKVSGATIHFAPGAELPEELITRIVKARMAENEE